MLVRNGRAFVVKTDVKFSNWTSRGSLLIEVQQGLRLPVELGGGLKLRHVSMVSMLRFMET